MKHLTQKYQAEMQVLIQPLVEYGIDHLTLRKKFHNGASFCLSTHADWIKHYTEMNYQQLCPLEKKTNLYIDGWTLWSELQQDPIYNAALQKFSISHGIALIKPAVISREIFHFATTDRTRSDLNAFYIENIALLEHFILLFREQTATLFQQIYKENLPEYLDSRWLQQQHGQMQQRKYRCHFDQISKPKKQYLTINKQKIYFTSKEVEIINLLKIGKTVGEIALLLGLAETTSYSHIKRIKLKSKSESLFDLGVTLREADPNGRIY